MEQCMEELAMSKSNEQEAFKEKKTPKKVRNTSSECGRSVKASAAFALPFPRYTRTNKHKNLVVFKDVEELQLLIAHLELLHKAVTSENMNDRQIDADSSESTAHWIIPGDSDDEFDQVGATIAIKKRLSKARKELQNLRAEREQERAMITAIVKQRDVYRVLLAQSDRKSLEGDAANSSGAQESAASMERPSSRHGSVDVGIESRKLREARMEFDDYKMEKQANVKLLQEALEQERSKCSELRLAQMQAHVEATCSKGRYEASEERCKNLFNELVRLRSKADHLSSLILQHQQMRRNWNRRHHVCKVLQSKKVSAVREAEFLRKNEEKLHAELTTLRLDNMNLLKLIESTQKEAAVTELTKLKERHSQLNERHGRLEEQKKALEEKLTACETAKQNSLAAASGGVTASWEKERQTLKAQLELETKKSIHPDINRVLKSFQRAVNVGTQELNKGKQRFEDQNAANAAQPVVTQEKTPVPSPPLSPLVPPSTTTMTTSATQRTQFRDFGATTERPEEPSNAGSVEAMVSKPGIATVPAAVSSFQTDTVATIVASTTSAANTTTESSVLSTTPPAVAAPVQVVPATAPSVANSIRLI
ncbi:hypothetical protein PsorP6_003321 [Peronosclerospora sorghi]|uniref:Uncharacterized protein n=1 Tax=Peronosclerospora sorghi TaxID=230839 RepID=A0ACC0VN06_9STRA|nr:hypothetical protein PsorP6_003321 [Peronosclerospora sorghi]